jgi:hypothetical protein
MFAHEPERWVSASGTDIAQFTGSTPRSTGLRFMEQVRGQFPIVIDRTVQLLWARSEHGYRSTFD